MPACNSNIVIINSYSRHMFTKREVKEWVVKERPSSIYDKTQWSVEVCVVPTFIAENYLYGAFFMWSLSVVYYIYEFRAIVASSQKVFCIFALASWLDGFVSSYTGYNWAETQKHFNNRKPKYVSYNLINWVSQL